MSILQRLERVFIWLSGASSHTLESCPAWERRKYVAFGATVLVPSSFALIAAAYAISTLTDDWRMIAPVSLVWSFIILTVDRALLATYRAYQSFVRKLAQFALRMVVAALMGMTIAHPMSLLLFRDTINSVVEEDRQQEIDAERAKGLEARKAVEARVPVVEKEIAAARERWNETFSAKFLEGAEKKGDQPMTEDEKKAQAELDKLIAEATSAQKEQLAALEKQIGEQDAANKKLGAELNFWQTEFEKEVNGQRSGIIGLGPRAKSIQDDQLAWRRLESKRLAGVLESLTNQKKALAAEIDVTTNLTTEQFRAKQADLALKQKAEQARLDALRVQVQQQQADQFVEQQNGIRGTLQKQIDAQLEQLKGLHEEINRLAQDEEARVTDIRNEARRDILTQTLALHRLFEKGNEGGTFAYWAYVILTLLFMLVDTIPLVVKFFSKAGPYDTLLDLDEVRFDRERKTFLESFHRYMDGLTSGPFLHLTRNKPLEAALIEGVDRSRAAKEFLEHLLGLEKAFEEKVRIERERIASESMGERATEKIAMLEDMVQAFYTDLRGRMEAFFSQDAARRVASI
ncbi:MAG: DUF4407 domain-containing protein [Verrucomicrobiaceae bacterium]|nr:DUF4407 domain-containing protein [Verrucomicrobiaceae bacterium]